jgi:hypothetical protein
MCAIDWGNIMGGPSTKLRILSPWGPLLPIVLLAGASIAAEDARPSRRVVFNDDCQVLVEAPQTNTAAFIQAWFDREAEAVPFTTFVILAALPDICVYDTKVGEVYGERLEGKFEDGWTRSMRALRGEGTDVVKLACDYMRARSYEVLAAIRMNDTHHRSIDPQNPLCPQFTIDHPECVIRQPDGRKNETALDYSYAGVRAHLLAIMREIVEQYDVDGLELNFVRSAKHFPRHQGREKAPILTAYLGEIRKTLDAAAKKRGIKRLTLGVRVPESVETCWLSGIDIQTWAEMGCLDYVVIAVQNNTDPQVPVEEFTRFTKPARVETLVAMGNMMGARWYGLPKILDRGVAISPKHGNSYVGMLLTEAEARAAAANYYAQGADGISFWNVGIYFGRLNIAAPEQRERIRRWTSAVVDPERVYDAPRLYRFLPLGKGVSQYAPPRKSLPWYEEGKTFLGRPASPVLRFDQDRVGKRLAFPFRMADGREGTQLKGRIRFWVYHLSEDDRLTVDINSEPVDPARITRIPCGELRGGLPGQRFEIDLSDCPPFREKNELGMTLAAEKLGPTVPYMEELEVLVE